MELKEWSQSQLSIATSPHPLPPAPPLAASTKRSRTDTTSAHTDHGSDSRSKATAHEREIIVISDSDDDDPPPRPKRNSSSPAHRPPPKPRATPAAQPLRPYVHKQPLKTTEHPEHPKLSSIDATQPESPVFPSRPKSALPVVSRDGHDQPPTKPLRTYGHTSQPSRVANRPVSPAPVLHIPQPRSTLPVVVKHGHDHLGRRLSEQALQTARMYWASQRQVDYTFPPHQLAHVLIMGFYRYKYSLEVLGGRSLTPGSRTYEPPPVDDADDGRRPPAADQMPPEVRKMAKKYWACLQEVDADNGDMVVDPLVRLALLRGEYTRRALGLERLERGTRTFEPPYVDPSKKDPLSRSRTKPSTMNVRPSETFPKTEPLEDKDLFYVDLSGTQPSNMNSGSSEATPKRETSEGCLLDEYPSKNPQPAKDIPAVAAPGQTLSAEERVKERNPDVGLVPLEAWEEKVKLSPEQRALVDLAASGKNIFYTGSAGCGKSTVLHAIRRHLRWMGKTVQVMAPTGKVALQIGGMTTWTWAGWAPDSQKRMVDTLARELLFGRSSKRNRKRFEEVDVIIIDEISMVENFFFERLNQFMQRVRQDQRPFGGVQVIVTGDFCQLPPVKPFEYCVKCGTSLRQHDKETEEGWEAIYVCPSCRSSRWRDSDKWAFRSQAWQDCEFVNIELKAVHRQNDGLFISMLQKCRQGIRLDPDEVDILMDHPSVTEGAMRLFSTRREVQRINELEFARIDRPSHEYRCKDSIRWTQNTHWRFEKWKQLNADGTLKQFDDNHRLEQIVQLKENTLVVLMVNLDLGQKLCNGSQGYVCGFEPYDPQKKLPEDGGESDNARLKEAEIRKFVEAHLARGITPAWPIVKFHNEVTRTIYPQCLINEIGDESPYTIVCRTQIPLAHAWALTIHKSQGMTLDRVSVNLSRAFEEGQVYVALSRATSLEGLKIEGSSSGLDVGIGGNKEVREFLNSTKWGV